MRLFLVLVFLFFTQPVFAQEGVPELPDCTKWATRSPYVHLGYYKVKKSQIGLLDLHFTSENDCSAMIVFRPISGQTYEHLKTLLTNSPPSESIDKKVISLAGRKAWLMLYYPPDNSPDYGAIYLYERTRRWSEFYYFWKPRWRFVIFFADDCTYGNCIEIDEYEKFFENRYGLSYD